MSYFFFVIWSVALATYFYWAGSRNGRDEGIQQVGELWPIELGPGLPVDQAARR